MRPQIAIDIFAATVPRRFGWALAEKLGFSKDEFHLLWWLASYPRNMTKLFQKAQLTQLLEIMSARSKDASRLIRAIQIDTTRRKDSNIRSVLLDISANPPNWTLPDVDIADLVFKRMNRKPKKAGEFPKMVETVKKMRQYYAKKFPVFRIVEIRPVSKGNSPAS